MDFAADSVVHGVDFSLWPAIEQRCQCVCRRARSLGLDCSRVHGDDGLFGTRFHGEAVNRCEGS
jgi:hypothetical protein